MKRHLLALLTLGTACLGLNADAYSGSIIADEGAWCWFADPRAIHYSSSDGTIDASYLGYIDVHGNIKASQLDFKTGQQTDVLVRSYFQPDDHNNPTFLVLPDQRIFIIYSRHTDEAAFYYRVSQKPGDITTLGEEHRIATANNTTYPSPFIMADDPNHIYLCWRGIGWHPTIGRLTMPTAENDVVDFDWGPFQMVQSTGARPYAKYHSNGKDKIYVTYTTGHPDNEQPNWVYFNVININNGNGATLEDIKGNKLSTIADGKFNVNKTDSYKSQYPYTVVDAPSAYRDWVWQTTPDKDGNPVIAMVRINGGKTEHIYHYAKWTGSEWRVTELANGGGRFHSSNTEYCYSGGMALDPEDPSIIYLSIPTDGANGKVYEIWKYTVDANGKVSASTAVTTDSEKNNVRPWVLPGSADSKLRLAWMNGDYYYWMVQKNYPLGYPTSIRANFGLTEDATVPASVAKCDAGASSISLGSSQSAFSLYAGIQLSASNYGGLLVSSEKFSYGIDPETVLPYAIVNGTRYNSSNKFYTSDDWATNSSGTSGDNWATKIADFALFITYDGSNLCIYRNAMLDQKIAVSGLTAKDFAISGFQGSLNGAQVWKSALTNAVVKAVIASEAINNIKVPEVAVTDIVLPAKVNGNNIAWTSSHPEIIAANGTFVAPAAETTVTLTATIAGAPYEYKVKAMPRNIAANILASYTFDAATDGVVADQSGKGNDLKVFGSAKVNGVLDLTANTAAGFDSNGYAVAAPAIMDGLRSYTFLLEVTPSSLASQPRLYDFGVNSGNSLFLRASALSAGIKYSGGTTTMVNGGTALEAGKTYKLAVTFDARTRTTSIYVNGALSASGTDNVNEPYMIAANASCDRNYIGRTQWWDGTYAKDNVDFQGTIDNFMVYNTAFTLDEVRAAQGYEDIEEDESLNIDRTSVVANPGFEGSYSAMSNSGVAADRAIYQPEGWTVARENGDENDMTVLNASADLQGSMFTAIPTTQGGGKNAYLVRQKWGTSTISLSQKIEEIIPAAIYRVKADAWQSGLGGQGTVWAQSGNGNKEAASASSPNEEKWQSAQVAVMNNGVDALTIGLTAAHTAGGSEKFLGFDNVTLVDVTANATEADMLALIQALVPAAKGFQGDNALNPKSLAEAIEKGEGVGSSDSRDALYEAYKALRDAIYNERAQIKTDETDALGSITADDASMLPVYDLTGRMVLKAGESHKINTLPAGIYLQGSTKIIR